MKSIIEKQYLIIGETGIQKTVSSGKDLNRKLDSSLKDLGLTKNDIIYVIDYIVFFYYFIYTNDCLYDIILTFYKMWYIKDEGVKNE